MHHANDELAEKNPAAAGEDRLQTHVNKWLIAHPEGGLGDAVPKGLYGRNWTTADLELQESGR